MESNTQRSILRTFALCLLKSAFILLLAACRVTPTPHPPATIHLGGAHALQLIARDLTEAYRRTHPYATFEIRASNSTIALREFAQGQFDIALASRSPRADELANTRTPGERSPPRAIDIARDGIAVVIHPSNPLTNVTREQLGKIYTGEIYLWSQLNANLPPGSDDAIQVISREDGSGTRSVFEQIIMNGRRVTLTALTQTSDADVLRYVANNPNALGYVSANVWESQPRVHAMMIDGVAPMHETIQSGAYPLLQTLYFVVADQPRDDVSDFIDFVLSPSGHEVIQNRAAPLH